MEHEPRYERNRLTISPLDQQVLAQKRVCICGCGGIGGYVVEMLARAGVGTIVVVDGDVFEVSNLNRQLLATEVGLGTSKAQAAAERVRAINSGVNVVVVADCLDDANAETILSGADVAVDALDSAPARFLLQNWCARLDIPLVHGAIAGWCAQVTTIAPGSNTLDTIYPASADTGDEARAGNPSFTPALAASIESAECIKVLLGKVAPLYGKLLTVDLLRNSQRVISLE